MFQTSLEDRKNTFPSYLNETLLHISIEITKNLMDTLRQGQGTRKRIKESDGLSLTQVT